MPRYVVRQDVKMPVRFGMCSILSHVLLNLARWSIRWCMDRLQWAIGMMMLVYLASLSQWGIRIRHLIRT